MNQQLLDKLRREYVRHAIRDGKTIAQIRAEWRSKRYRDERKALAAMMGRCRIARLMG